MSEDENNCEYVSSRGILKSCHIYSSNPVSSITTLIDYDFSKFKEGDTIYVCATALKDFFENLDKIRGRFTLVTGDCDIDVPSDIFPNYEDLQRLLEPPMIIHWYTQNCSVNHPKITPIPIGLDYHTMVNPTHWGESFPPKPQEMILKNVKALLPPFEKRQMRCYSNFHFSMTTRYAEERHKAINEIDKDLVYYEPQFCHREQSWRNQGQFMFVLSPFGNGRDCHRTWEALCLGCIPIVKRSNIDRIFENLPVWIVDEWEEVNRENMEKKAAEFLKGTYDYNRLTLKYWINKIKKSHLL